MRGLLILLALVSCDAQRAKPVESLPGTAANRTTTEGSDPLVKCCFYDGEQTAYQAHFAERNVVSRAKPEYPPAAMAAGVEGDVKVAIRIRADGHVAKACAMSGPDALRGAAEAAALKWTFRAHGHRLDRVDHIVFTFRVSNP